VKTDPGFIYFVQQYRKPSGPVKIGWSIDPRRRLADLQGGSPVRLRLLGFAPGTRVDERRLHSELVGLWSHGEWFRPSPELWAVVLRELGHGGEETPVSVFAPRKIPSFVLEYATMSRRGENRTYGPDAGRPTLTRRNHAESLDS
jgi:hypothetical protein